MKGNSEEQQTIGKDGFRKNYMGNFDRTKLPAHRFLKWLMENELSKKYLFVCEGVLLAALGGTIYLYYFK